MWVLFVTYVLSPVESDLNLAPRLLLNKDTIFGFFFLAYLIAVYMLK